MAFCSLIVAYRQFLDQIPRTKGMQYIHFIAIQFIYGLSYTYNILMREAYCHSSDGNTLDISQAGSLHQYLLDLHEKYGPVASFWLGAQFCISLGSASYFKFSQHFFDRPGIDCIYRHEYLFIFIKCFISYSQAASFSLCFH